MEILGRNVVGLRGQRVLITGGHGFLGRHVRKVVETKTDSEAVVCPFHQDWDLTRQGDTKQLFYLIKPDVVFHLAADCGGIDENIKRPADMFSRNLQMGLNILDACVVYKVKKLVIAGTSCSYPEIVASPLTEDLLWYGNPAADTAPYGLAKRALIVAAQAFRKQFGLITACPILANLYGPGDHSSHVVADLCRKALTAKEGFVVYGDGSQTREFLYVEDAAQALVEVAERYDDPEPINVGTGKPTTIAELVKTICFAADNQVMGIYDLKGPVGHHSRWLDVSKIRERLGWTARTSLEWGIKRTIEAYRSSPVEQLATASLHP